MQAEKFIYIFIKIKAEFIILTISSGNDLFHNCTCLWFLKQISQSKVIKYRHVFYLKNMNNICHSYKSKIGELR